MANREFSVTESIFTALMTLQTEEVQFKCFLEANDEAKYAEFYINVDLPNQKLYFNEKDPDYRENIIRYFSA